MVSGETPDAIEAAPEEAELTTGEPIGVLCPIHETSLDTGPYPVWDEEGNRYLESVRCDAGGELYAAEVGPPPFTPVWEDDPTVPPAPLAEVL